MSKLDTLLEKYTEVEDFSFNFNRDFNEVLRQIEELSFLAEIDRDNYYLTFLEQIFVKENGKWSLVNLDDAQREEFYTKGHIDAYPNGFRIACTLHMYINSVEEYVQTFVSREIIKEIKDPKDDYGTVFTEYHKSTVNRPFERSEFVVKDLEDDNPAKEVFNKLLKAFKVSKTNKLDISNFDLKVYQDVSMYWGNLTNKSHLIDDELQESAAPERVDVPAKYKKYSIDLDKELYKTIHGTCFSSVDYYTNGYVKECNSYSEAAGIIFSLVDYINEGKVEMKVHPEYDKQHIDFLEKHYFSNMWPTISVEEGKDAEKEADELSKKLTKYEVAVTRFQDEIVFKLEVWEYGIVYVITNAHDNRTIDMRPRMRQIESVAGE